jgi:exodeoxyribonuclease V alpha subunit
MTVDIAGRDRFADDLVLGADPVLEPWNRAGLLSAADLHLVDRLGRLSGERLSDTAKVGVALAMRAVRRGSTCLALDQVTELLASTESVAQESVVDVRIPSGRELFEALAVCPLVTGSPAGPLRPLVLVDSEDGPLLYLHKYFRQEHIIRSVLDERAARVPDVDPDAVREAVYAAFGSPDGDSPDGDSPDKDAEAGSPRVDARQRLAGFVAAGRWITVLAGGPGTGKTFTVARILATLEHLSEHRLRIGLCAPTGRAAAQLESSVASYRRDTTPIRAVTVHSLLGWRPGANPRYNRTNTLPHDVVVVDETSMLSMTAMSYVLDAIRPDARIIFVGDPHQLESVDAGAVLADLVDRVDAGEATTTDAGRARVRDAIASAGMTMADDVGDEPDPDVDPDSVVDDADLARISAGVITLRRGHRNSPGIATLAAAINDGDADRVAELVRSGLPGVVLIDPTGLDPVQTAVTKWGLDLQAAAEAGDDVAALAALNRHRVLCAHREGRWGVQGWTDQITEWTGTASYLPLTASTAMSQAGRPVLVTVNDKETDTSNGDCGVVIRDVRATVAPGDPVPLTVAFARGESGVHRVHPARLSDVVPAYAMTIHRSQGSQYGAVTVVLPPIGSELLTRELLYTAITRAQTEVWIVGTLDVLTAAVDRRVARASGLRSRIRALGD